MRQRKKEKGEGQKGTVGRTKETFRKRLQKGIVTEKGGGEKKQESSISETVSVCDLANRKR